MGGKNAFEPFSWKIGESDFVFDCAVCIFFFFPKNLPKALLIFLKDTETVVP